MSKKKFTSKTDQKTAVSSQTSTKPTTVNLNLDSEKKIRKNIYYLIFIVSFMLYGNTIPNEFAMDDELVTLDHKIVSKGITAIPEIFATRYVQNDQQSYEYRPIVQVTFAIEHQFTGGNPHFSHFINILLYALTGVLLFQLLSLMFLNFHWILPASITFLFLIHPIHSEVVASLKNRDELLSFIFTLLSIRAILLYFDKTKYKYIVFGILFFILALLSKKSALPLIITLPLILYFFRDLSLKKVILYFIAPIVIIILLNKLVDSSLETVNRPGLFFENPYYVDQPTLIEKIPMAFYSMGYYIKLLILPYPLLVYYGYSYVEIEGWGNIITILSVLFFIGGGIYSLLNLSKKNILIFGFLYFTFNIFAFSNLLPMPGIIADRFAYGASLGFSIMISFLVFKLMKVNLEKGSEIKIPSQFTYGFIALFLICNIYLFQRNKDWKDHLTIYLADVEKAPESAKLNALIGGYCMQTLEQYRNGKLEKKLTQEEFNNYIRLSDKHFKAAIQLYPDYVASLNNMGTLYYSYKSELDSSAQYFERVLALEPKHVQANFNLGSYYEIQFGSLDLMDKIISRNFSNDSLSKLNDKLDKKWKKYIYDILPFYRATNLAYTDLTKTFQQFIDDSRNTNGNVNRDNYINAINNYWNNVLLKYKVDPNQSLLPGNDFIQLIVNSNYPDPNEFSLMLQNAVHTKFIQQFQPIFNDVFKSSFSRDIDTNDYFLLLNQIKNEKDEISKKMIKCFNTALYTNKFYPPAYQKLSQLYSSQKLWEELLALNKKVLESDETSRFVDIYRMMGTAYFYSNREQEGIKYFDLAITEEIKILRKAEISLQQQSVAGLNISVQKLNKLVMGSRGNIYQLYMNMGAMYNSMGNEEKANECLKLSTPYKI